MTVDHSLMKLGKRPPSNDPRTLKLAKYIDLSALPPIPAETNRSAAFATGFPMFLNDQLGDCTCAAVGHMQQFWGDLSGKAEPLTDDDVLKLYEKVGGYVPNDPSTDNGAVETDVLNYWRRTGITEGSRHKKITGYAQIEVSHLPMVRAATYLFDGIYTGVSLPITAQNQDTWDVVPGGGSDVQPGSWGGHAVPVVDFDSAGVTLITWGALKRATWNFWLTYFDEAYAVLSADARNTHGLSAEGYKLAALKADLAAVTAA